MKGVSGHYSFCSWLFLIYFVLLYFENWDPAIFSDFLITSKAQTLFVVFTLIIGINQRLLINVKKYSYLTGPLLLFSIYFIIVSFGAVLIWGDEEIINIAFISNLITLICLLMVINQQPRLLLAIAFTNVLVVDFICVGAPLWGVGVAEATEFETGINRLRIFGLNPNGLSMYAAISGVCCSYALMQSISLWKKFFYALSMILVIILIIMCGSQGGAIFLFVALAIVFCSEIKKKKRAFIIPLFIIAVFALYFLFDYILTQDVFAERYQEDDITDGRVALFPRGIKVFMQSPIVGTGIAGYKYYMNLFYSEVRPTHNGYLDVLAYTGILGIGLFLLYLLRQFRLLTKKRKALLYPVALSLYLIFILNFAKDGGVLFAKFTWVQIAVLIALPYEIDEISRYISCKKNELSR